MTNKIIDNYLNEIQNVNEDFASIAGAAIKGISGVGMGVMGITGLVNLGFNLYKQFIAKNKNRCERMKTYDKQICYTQLQIEANQKFIAQLRSTMSDCRNTKDPTKCSAKMNERLRKLNNDLTKLREKLYNLQNQQNQQRGV